MEESGKGIKCKREVGGGRKKCVMKTEMEGDREGENNG